jgi:hypothetical protein
VADTTTVIGDISFTHLLDLAKNTLTSISSGLTASATGNLDLKEYVLDGLANVVAKQAIQSIVHGVVNWANNGFNGSPSFVVNLNVHLGNISDQTASKFFSQLRSSLGSPFQQQVSSAIQSSYYKSTSANSFFLLNQCTLGDATSAVSTSGFDFTKGGLSGWYKFATQPQNNPIGLSLAMQDELNSRATAAIQQSKDEISQNHGFLSWRGDCKLQGVAPPTVTATAPEFSAPNPDGSYNVVSQGATTVKDNGTNCLAYDIQTPGSVIESQLEKSLGSSVDSLVSADEINEIVGALAQGLIKNVLGGGGLSGVSQPQGGGADYFTQTAAAGDNAGVLSSIGGSLSTAITQEQTQIQQYQSNWQDIGAAAASAQTAVTAVANAPTNPLLTLGSCTFAEGPSASAVLQSVVNPVIDQANTAGAKAATSLSTLSSLQTIITATGSSTPTVDALTNAGLNFQQFLSASSTPSTSDIANAQSQDTDIGVQVGTSTPNGGTTLLSQMKNITAEASACTLGGTTTASSTPGH